MKKYFTQCILFVFFYLYFIFGVSSIPLGEYSCLGSLLNQNQLQSSFENQNSSNFFDYCSYSNFLCDIDQHITSIELEISSLTPNYQVSISDFSCFPNLDTLYLINFKVNPNLIYNVNSIPSLKNLEFKLCQGITNITQAIPPLDSLFINTDSNDTYTVLMSWIENIEQFGIYSISPLNQTNPHTLNSNFFTDSAVTNKDTLLYLGISTTSIPDLTGFSCKEVYMVLGKSFQYSSFEQLSTFSNVEELEIYYFEQSHLPLQIFHLSQLTILEIHLNFLKPSQLYDFSTFNKLKILTITDESPDHDNFGFNGFPISNIPLSLKEFYFECEIKKFPGDMTMFRNLNVFSMYRNFLNDTLPNLVPPNTPKFIEIQLYDNDIFGTVPQSYCYTLPDLSFNKLTGEIPNCFTCFFNDTTLFYQNQNLKDRFLGNQFTNLNIGEKCLYMIPNARIEDNNNTLVIYGESLGFNQKLLMTNFTGLNRDFKIVQASTMFKLDLTLYNPLNVFENGAKAIKVAWLVGNEKRTFTLPIERQQPIPSNITYYGNLNVLESNIEINGDFFTYNKSDVLVHINSYQCIVSSTTFYQIKCKIDNEMLKLPAEFLYTSISIYNHGLGGSTGVYIKIIEQEKYTNKLQCNPLLCDVATHCNLDDGICYPLIGCTEQCFSNGGSCLPQLGECVCKNNCSGQGNCNSETGECRCFPGRIGMDCSEIDCIVGNYNCSDHGICNTKIGKCDCSPISWVGEDCSKFQHTVTSIIAPNENGGQVSLFGTFGTNHTNISITIGLISCNVTMISDTLIICTIGPGKGIVEIVVTQNSLIWSSKSMFKYTNLIPRCLNDCSNHGKCTIETQTCSCFGNYTGLDCGYLMSSGNNDTSTPKVDENTGTGIINNGIIDYKVSITSLLEIDYLGTIVNEYDLSELWKLNSTTNKIDSNIHTFTQRIRENTCLITSTIEEVINDKSFTFAGLDFVVIGGSLKLSIQIIDYPYKSVLNTLQIRMKSSVFNNSNLPTNCDGSLIDDIVSVGTNGFKNDNDKLNYLTISKNDKTLFSRFLSKMESDQRPTFITSTIISTNTTEIIVGINLPHCSNCLLDPDFSVLLNSETKPKEQCDNSEPSKSNKTIIIAVTCSVGGAAIIGSIAFLIYRKKFVEKVLENKLKLLSKQSNK